MFQAELQSLKKQVKYFAVEKKTLKWALYQYGGVGGI